MAADHLGLDRAVRLSQTGGLTSFGGAGNDYALHSVVSVARRLREDATHIGLVFGQGEFVTKHHALLMAARPHERGWTGREDVAAPAGSGPALDLNARGACTIETYTVEFGRDGTPTRGLLVTRTDDGKRCPAVTTDPAMIAALIDTAREPIGREASLVDGPEGRVACVLP
jgi:acetyl-CoA C-acetyltransferase